MQPHTQIAQLCDGHHPRQSPNTQLAAALTALGIPLDEHLGAQHFVEGDGDAKKHRTVWTLTEKSPDGRFLAEEMIRVWNDDAWHQANPEHPLAWIRAAFRNYRKLLDFVHDQGPLAVLRKGDKTAVISRHTTPEIREKIMAGLNA